LNVPPYHSRNGLSTGKLLFAERKNVDKIRPFQIDEKGLPAKIHGSEKRKIREA
jgi:hypothetical protein